MLLLFPLFLSLLFSFALGTTTDDFELLRSENDQFQSLWYADRQPCTYTPSVDAAGTAIPCDDVCVQVLSTSSIFTQAVDTSRITDEMIGKTFVFSFQALARQISVTTPGIEIKLNVTDGYSSNTVSLPITPQSDTDAHFTYEKVSFTLAPESRTQGLNLTLHLRDPTSQNSATLYLDQLSFKPDSVIIYEHKSGPPTGAIVGGVLGGLALLVVLGLVVYFLARMRRGRLERRPTLLY